MTGPKLLGHLQSFAAEVTRKMTALVAGEPEDQLRSPLESLLAGAAEVFGLTVVAVGEAHLPDRIGTPDYAVTVGGLLTGYVELKAPGTGARPGRFRGHDKGQWERFKALPNLVYTDGNEWGLYRQGERIGGLVSLDGDVRTDGARAVRSENGPLLSRLLQDFLRWEPVVPGSPRQLAEVIAPLCRLLRDEVTEALREPTGALNRLASEWREYLFPGADDQQFADAYAQTVTYALLLSRTEGASTLDLHQAVIALRAEHSLLSRALEVITDDRAREEIPTSLGLLQRVVDAVDPDALAGRGGESPWLYFYEHFLSEYDPDLRRDAGVYYTPVEVVRAQVRLVDEILTDRLGKRLGFADETVVTLDPATGTGTYLLGVIDHAARRVKESEGVGAVPGRATHLAENLHGFELMVGPYSVAELRVTQELEVLGAVLPADGPHVYLTDTLESPTAAPRAAPFFYEPIAREHARALRVKESEPVLVCLGNPPYDRHAALTTQLGQARTGGWVRYGDGHEVPILEAFVAPVREAGQGVHLKNLYNLYVYFWRWALWKIFEHQTAGGPGVVSFISAASYLDGPAFAGMREHMRRHCDEIWLIDLGGENRGARQSENIFAIRTPVAVAVAVRYGTPSLDTPARVHYARIEGSREVKLQTLNEMQRLEHIGWRECPAGWSDRFRPAGTGPYFQWPLLADIFPWQLSGVQMKRTWPIGPDRATLERRWRSLLAAPDPSAAFRETRDRKVTGRYPAPKGISGSSMPIASLPLDEPLPTVAPYNYRSFDRQFVMLDNRVGDYVRAQLWRTHSDRQVYLTSLITKPLGQGPGAVASAFVPDMDHFSGRGAKDVIPLWRDSGASVPNVAPGLPEKLAGAYGLSVGPEALFAYCYGILAHPDFASRFAEELEIPGPRIPITLDYSLFVAVRTLGERLLWLHTYGERFASEAHQAGVVSAGSARCSRPVPATVEGYPDTFQYDQESRVLTVGEGAFEPVAPEVWAYAVSGLRIVPSWLGYRMCRRRGRRSSPLDEIQPQTWTAALTGELLRLLWVLEETIALHPRLAELLEDVVSGPLLAAGEVSTPPDESRHPLGEPNEVQLPGIV